MHKKPALVPTVVAGMILYIVAALAQKLKSAICILSAVRIKPALYDGDTVTEGEDLKSTVISPFRR